jgi:hypothetical protein
MSRPSPTVTHRRTVLTGLAALPVLAAARAGQARTSRERPFNLRVVMSGHSLTDPVPGPLSTIVQAAGGAASRGMVIDNSSIPGSPAEDRWQTDLNLPINARKDIANYDMLVLTERVPVRSTMKWHNSAEITLKWFQRAWTAGNSGKGAETVYYASWIGIGSGPGNDDKYDLPDEQLIPFRERLDLEMGSWQEIADFVNKNRPEGSPPMRVIPGPKIMAAVYDAISAGTAPGLTEMQDLFEDNIHPNAKGAFLVALAHFGVMYGRDPRNVPPLRGEAGWPTADQQAWMKTLVWDVLRAYPDSGLG